MKQYSQLAIKTVFLGTLISLSFGITQSTKAADQPNIMIMGEDADRDTIARHSRVFNRVKDALRTNMMELGFKVYSETATTMNATNPARVRRTDAELISVARQGVVVPIDLITTFQIYANAQKNAYSDIQQLKIRVRGRMIQVATGRALGNFEVSVGPRGLRPLPVGCNRDCILEHVGDQAKPIANEVGIILARKLDKLSPTARKSAAIKAPAPITPPAPNQMAKATSAKCTGLSTAYTIVLTGYDSAEIKNIEQIIVAFQGYEHHRPIRTQTRFSEYWYETCSDRARVERNLRTMSEQFPGQHRIALSGNRFEIQKIAGVGKR